MRRWGLITAGIATLLLLWAMSPMEDRMQANGPGIFAACKFALLAAAITMVARLAGLLGSRIPTASPSSTAGLRSASLVLYSSRTPQSQATA